MKAIICKNYGLPSDLEMQNVPKPKPSKNEVLIRVKACGVNFPDTLIIQGKYQFKPELPFSPGGDIAGVVESVGENVTRFKQGDEVIAMNIYGGFAEYAVAQDSMTLPKPPQMSMEEAASFTIAYGTSYHALKDIAHLKAGETLLVLGAAGGVGLCAVELGKLMGANVIAAASTDEKLAICTQYGADLTLNYSSRDLKSAIKELTEGKGVDVVYDPVGGQYSEQALRNLKWNGRFLVVGFASGEIPKMPLNLPLLKGCSIHGVFWGSFAMRYPKKNSQNMKWLVEKFEERSLRPHIHQVYPFEEAPLALQDLIERKVKGKAVVRIG